MLGGPQSVPGHGQTEVLPTFSLYLGVAHYDLNDPILVRSRAMRSPSLYVVNFDRLVLKILVEPVQDMLQPFDAMPRRARTRQFVGFVRETHHDCRNPAVLQCA